MIRAAISLLRLRLLTIAVTNFSTCWRTPTTWCMRACDASIKTRSVAEPSSELSARQRFSLAHEIAHTLFYRFSNPVPAPEDISNELELEKTCDRTAGHILIPTDLLKRDVGDYARIDAGFIQWVATRYRTSLAVAIERLKSVEPSNPFERCILLVRRVNGDGYIRAAYFGVGMYRTLPRPTPFARLTEWISDIPIGFIQRKSGSDWRTARMGRSLGFEKTELESGRDFLLQVQVLPTGSETRVA